MPDPADTAPALVERDGEPSAATLAMAAIIGALVVFVVFGYVSAVQGAPVRSNPIRVSDRSVGGALTGPAFAGGGARVLSSSGHAIETPDGQRVDVGMSAGELVPNYIRVSSGRPVEIRFGRGAQAPGAIRIPEAGVACDLRASGSVVVPALHRGVYTLTDEAGCVCGVIVAE